MKTVTIIDYGMSNLLSITRAFEHVGAKVKIAVSSTEIMNSDYLVLPGVGAFPDGMKELHSREMVRPIREHAISGKPLLGVCLGMQMLLTLGHEHHTTEGLDLIKGQVLPLPKEMAGFKVPNINWHEIKMPSEGRWDSTILSQTKNLTDVYFVHSYYAKPDRTEDILATSKFGDLEFAAAVQNNNVSGTQFHPEKSGEEGLGILSHFLKL